MMISGSAVPNKVGAWSLRRRKSYARIAEVLPVPPLIQVQLESYRWFCETGLRELFDEISPIVSFNKALELHFPGFGNTRLPSMSQFCFTTGKRISHWCKRYTWASSRS